MFLNSSPKTTHIIIIIRYIYHALINALSAHMIHINLYYTHVEHSSTKTIYIIIIKNYIKKKHYKQTNTHTHTHTHTH